LIVVERSVSVEAERARVRRIIIIIIKLYPEVVELSVSDHAPHIRLRDRTLWCSGDVVGV
jgi:hypothetical protein